MTISGLLFVFIGAFLPIMSYLTIRAGVAGGGVISAQIHLTLYSITAFILRTFFGYGLLSYAITGNVQFNITYTKPLNGAHPLSDRMIFFPVAVATIVVFGQTLPGNRIIGMPKILHDIAAAGRETIL